MGCKLFPNRHRKVYLRCGEHWLRIQVEGRRFDAGGEGEKSFRGETWNIIDDNDEKYLRSVIAIRVYIHTYIYIYIGGWVHAVLIFSNI